jgi:hypothetical protein
MHLDKKPDFSFHERLNQLTYKVNLSYIDLADVISNYFYYHEHLPDLWEIVRVVSKNKEHCDMGFKETYIVDLYSVYKVIFTVI